VRENPSIPKRPRLRLGVRAVRIGAETLLFIGGPRPIKIAGTKLADAILSLLRAMDGHRTLGDLAALLDRASAEQLAESLDLLNSGDLLKDGPQDSYRNLDNHARLVDRLGGCRAPAFTVATRLYDIGDKESVAILDSGTCDMRIVVDPHFSESSKESLESHRDSMIEAGMPVANSLNFERRCLAAPPARSTITKDNHASLATESPIDQAEAGERLLSEVCRYAVGYSSGTKRRHIAPSAGDLRSTHAFCIVPSNAASSKCYYFDPFTNRLVLYRTVTNKEPSGGVPIVCFVTNRSRLNERYGTLARRLSLYDAGVAAEHGVRAATCAGAGVSLSWPDVVSTEARVLGNGDWRLSPVLCLRLHASNPEASLQECGINTLDLETMLQRRSRRSFSKDRLEIRRLTSAEAVALHSPAVKLILDHCSEQLNVLRLVRTEEDRYLVGAVHGPQPSATWLQKESIRRMIEQIDLQDAPLHYLILHSIAAQNRKPMDSTDRPMIAAGVLCSALLFEATKRGLAGAAYGRLSVNDVRLSAIPLHGIALCLGVPS